MNTGLLAVHHAVFADSDEKPDREEILALWPERLTRSGVVLDRDRYLRGCHNSFASITSTLANRFRADGPLDIIVVAHATPDADARISLAGTLAAGQTLVFAISDLGRIAPFSALEVVRSHQEGRALVIAVDQGTVPYADPQLALLDTTADHAVGLLLGTGGPADLRALRLLTNIPPDRVVAAVEAELSAAPVDLAILGAHVPSVASHLARRAPADQLCSAVWSVLAQELSAPNSQCRHIAVIEYEPELQTIGFLHVEISLATINATDMRCAP